jgi:hypothetical protein
MTTKHKIIMLEITTLEKPASSYTDIFLEKHDQGMNEFRQEH